MKERGAKILLISYIYKMRKISLLLVLFTTFMNAQTQGDRAAITQSLAEQQAAWNRGSIADFMKAYWQSDSLQFIGSKGITYGWQKTLDNYLKSYDTKEKMGQLNFTLLEFKQLSPTAVFVIGKWQLEREKPIGGHFTLLWRKINGNWFIVCDHTS